MRVPPTGMYKQVGGCSVAHIYALVVPFTVSPAASVYACDIRSGQIRTRSLLSSVPCARHAS